jgi:uncharacterized integral membrane protein
VPEDLPLLPEQPSTSDNLRRFGPAAIITVVALMFILQNTESVRFNLLWFDFRWPLWAMLLVFMAIGALMAWGVDRRRTRRSRND